MSARVDTHRLTLTRVKRHLEYTHDSFYWRRARTKHRRYVSGVVRVLSLWENPSPSRTGCEKRDGLIHAWMGGNRTQKQHLNLFWYRTFRHTHDDPTFSGSSNLRTERVVSKSTRGKEEEQHQDKEKDKDRDKDRDKYKDKDKDNDHRTHRANSI